jgi:hypothetical protein
MQSSRSKAFYVASSWSASSTTTDHTAKEVYNVPNTLFSKSLGETNKPCQHEYETTANQQVQHAQNYWL